ncbi:MAG: glycosyltransferase family 2 protein [Patescibacteria group bacterium]
METKAISLIMPAYNEENTIERAVESSIRKLEEHNFDYEILIFDDGSTDKTAEIAYGLALKYPKIKVLRNTRNMNLGYNFARGIWLASKPYAGLLPCHGLIAAESFDYILPAIGKADVVIAYIKNPGVRPLARRIISLANVVLLNLIFGLRIRYYHLNFYRTDQLRKVPTSTRSYSLMVELLVYLVASGATTIEVPFFLRKRVSGKSKALRLKNITDILKTYSRLFWRIMVLKNRINL